MKVVPIDEPRPVATVVAQLEEMLEQAKAGEITGFVCVTEARDKTYTWTISGPITWAGTVYALERLRHAVQRRIDGDLDAYTIGGPELP